jgi:hypothetical protein
MTKLLVTGATGKNAGKAVIKSLEVLSFKE